MTPNIWYFRLPLNAWLLFRASIGKQNKCSHNDGSFGWNADESGVKSIRLIPLISFVLHFPSSFVSPKAPPMFRLLHPQGLINVPQRGFWFWSARLNKQWRMGSISTHRRRRADTPPGRASISSAWFWKRWDNRFASKWQKCTVTFFQWQTKIDFCHRTRELRQRDDSPPSTNDAFCWSTRENKLKYWKRSLCSAH